MKFKSDCRFFKGEKPCRPYQLCSACRDYQSMGKRILIIKLGAIGDVLRTTPLLYGLKKKWPHSFITWLTYPEAREVLEHNPLIDCLLSYNLSSVLGLEIESFDLLFSLDKMMEAAALAAKIKAKEKKGFVLGSKGELLPLDNDSLYAYRLGLDDKFKFKENKKTYQEIIFEMAGLPCRGEEYILNLSREEKEYTQVLRKKYHLSQQKVVGLNTGCGKVFAAKKWTPEGFIELSNLLSKMGIAVLLLGGPEEEERNACLARQLKGKAAHTGCNNTLRQFMSLIDLCDVVVTADTIALHLAVGLKKKVIALFGSTSAPEIDLYNRGEKMRVGVKCSPCYLRECNKGHICMTSLTGRKVFEAVKKWL